MQLKIKADTTPIKEKLDRLQKRTKENQSLMVDIGEIIKTSINKNFSEGGRPTKWIPSLRVMKHGGKTLIDSGRLRSSITADAKTNEVRVGTNVKYGSFLQFGTYSQGLKRKLYAKKKDKRAKRKGLPPRPFVVMQKEDIIEINFAINEYLKKD